MDIQVLLSALLLVAAIIIIVVIKYLSNKDRIAQRALDKYLNGPLTNAQIGQLYERYIGYLYESNGHNVVYYGAINRLSDMGRDLIVKCDHETLVVQTKYWAKDKIIHEKHIFQLFGSTVHYKITNDDGGLPTKAVFYTTAQFSNAAKDVAKVLNVDLKTEKFNRSYPMIKCNISTNGNKVYHLPIDAYYDNVKVDLNRDEYFVRTVKEAVAKGFRRAG